jgi:DNA-binding transcriptional regulator LsrR (DeoR family)
MYSLEIYGRVRRAVFVEGKNQRAVAKEYGFARETVRKMLRYSAPAGLPAGTSGEAAQAAAKPGW